MSATDLSEVTALSAVCEQYATGGSEAEVRSRLKEVHDAAVAASKFWNGRAKLLGTRPPRPAEELLVEGVDSETVWQQLQTQYKDLFAEDEDDEEEVSERDAAAEARALEAENAKDARDKHWSLRGEVWASDRPEDSLLGSDLTWDVKRKRGAVDADLTAKLEEVIKERIGEGRFDEVASAELQEKALDKPKPAVDDGDLGMAPRAGLAEEYEREYLGVQESKPTRDEAIDALWARLSGKLDALSHFHTAPQKPSLDLEAAAKIADIPAVSLEETTPLAVAATDHRAPEEVHAKKRGKASTLRASDEATTQERRATRAAKKRARNAKRKRLADDAKIVARLNPSRSLLRYDKKEDEPSKNLRPDAELPPSSKKSASTHLFEQLTEEARRVVHGDAAAVVPGDDVRSSTKRRRGAGAAAALKL
ncbi:hypothetical protein CTAYLR_001571 [Chrysophaeum taylorii]|uniref:Uncharacterized protein n=1 Tax=Chrysophaeum taylorii TaxID=2483200 RepID=A0AAD7UD82_9STRA|nr:hypothetical protein CTAYLR_001571 [Chrysophaeum taylorii]